MTELTHENYINFMSYYGQNGRFKLFRVQNRKLASDFKKDELIDVSYQDVHKAWIELGKFKPKTVCEYDAFSREMLRDQLLYMMGKKVVGYIFSPDDKWIGIEHLQK